MRIVENECFNCGREMGCGCFAKCRDCRDKEKLRLMKESGTIADNLEKSGESK